MLCYLCDPKAPDPNCRICQGTGKIKTKKKRPVRKIRIPDNF